MLAKITEASFIKYLFRNPNSGRVAARSPISIASLE